MRRTVHHRLVRHFGSVALAGVLLFGPPAYAQGGDPPWANPSADANADGWLDISDCVFLLRYMFSSGPAPASCDVSSGLEQRVAELESELADAQAALAEANARIEELEVPGCTDPEAVNYDCKANVDDGSCEFEGCTDTEAANFDPRATIGDGSCLPVVAGFTFLGSNAQGYGEYSHDLTELVFVYLPGGIFDMGTPEGECDRLASEGPVHPVPLSAFLIAKHEISQRQWLETMGVNPSSLQPGGLREDLLPPELREDERWLDLPVETISWEDAEEFCEGTGLALPTEAQWEYACRAGTETPFGYGEHLDSVTEANFNGTSPVCDYATGDTRLHRSTVIGSFSPNPAGLHDMHGNVFEWCEDVYDPEFYGSEEATVADPVSTEGSENYVRRGGAWPFTAGEARSGYRGSTVLSVTRSRTIGLRPAFNVPHNP